MLKNKKTFFHKIIVILLVIVSFLLAFLNYQLLCINDGFSLSDEVYSLTSLLNGKIKENTNPAYSHLFYGADKDKRTSIQGSFSKEGKKYLLYASFEIGEKDAEGIKIALPSNYRIISITSDYRNIKDNPWYIDEDSEEKSAYVQWGYETDSGVLWGSDIQEVPENRTEFVTIAFDRMNNGKIPSGGGKGTIAISMVQSSRTTLPQRDTSILIGTKEVHITDPYKELTGEH